MHSFDTSEKRMEEGQALVHGAGKRPARICHTFLPHTGILMTLEYTTEPEAPVTGPSPIC